MIFARQKAHIAALAAAIEQDRARMRTGAAEIAASARDAAGSPLGLGACFAAGLAAAPLFSALIGASRGHLGGRGLAAAAAWGWELFERGQAAAMRSTGSPENSAPGQG